MAIGAGSLLEVSLKASLLGMQVLNVFQYKVEVYPGNINAAQVAQAWWNHVKNGYRGLATDQYTNLFRSVFVRELNNATGEVGEYNIPSAEQTPTRSAGAASDTVPPFMGMGVRLLVATRATRPGQKRLFGFAEADQVGGLWQTGALNAATTLMTALTQDIVLGAPAATMSIKPRVVRKDLLGVVTADQQIVGFLINQNVTTQNSRKFGRGS